jgi:hypothetical protein
MMIAKTIFSYCVYPLTCAYTGLRRILEKHQPRTHCPIDVGLLSPEAHNTLINPHSPSPYGCLTSVLVSQQVVDLWAPS